MSGTYRILLVLAVFMAAPVKALAFDFDKEIAKQNNVSIEILDKKDERVVAKASSRDKNLKVTLIARKR
ncbi:MAG: hypothetical protein KDD58_05735 [Bdellovibrionales bacterium]|nr:hypothetical protein [Bdellovibrionales bacterium]